MQRDRRTGRSRKGAALYLTALFAAVLSASLAAALVAGVTVTRRAAEALDRAHAAEWIARSGLNWALRRVYTDPDWRTTLPVGPDGLWTATPVPVGGGTFQVWGTDPDGDLSDDPIDPVELVIEATLDDTRVRRRVLLVPYNRAIVQYAGFAWENEIELSSGATLKGPLRGNWDLRTNGLFSIDVLSGGKLETVNGAKVDPLLVPYTEFVTEPLTQPTPDLAWYISRGTSITVKATDPIVLSKVALSPTQCRYNGTDRTPNSEGIYVLDAAGKEVVISDCYVNGTLAIANCKKVTLTGAVRLVSKTTGNPGFIVDCGPKDELRISPTNSYLVELLDGIDYNEDGDADDLIPTRISGVVWCSSNVVVDPVVALTCKGLLVGRKVKYFGLTTVKEDLELINNPTRGFLGPGMRMSAGSWQIDEQ